MSGQPYAGLGNSSGLESALGRAENHWYYGDASAPPEQRLMQSAAMMGHGVAQKQAFEDGNKRTAYWLMHGLLSQYGLGHVMGSEPGQFSGHMQEDDPEMATIVNGWGEHTHEPQHLFDLWNQRHQTRPPQ